MPFLSSPCSVSVPFVSSVVASTVSGKSGPMNKIAASTLYAPTASCRREGNQLPANFLCHCTTLRHHRLPANRHPDRNRQ